MKAYFFDLDGTLTDARPGLYFSFRAALSALDLPDLSDEELNLFLGTPLPEMFRVLKPGIAKARIAAGMDAFRCAYEAVGIKQNRLYPGVPELLGAIGREGSVAWVVTSKPERYAVQVAGDLKIDRYLQGVVGAGLDETDTKGELIARALAVSHSADRDTIMLGDRYYDIVGAIENRVMPVGALWGYGAFEELYAAGCRRFVASVEEFRVTFVETDRL